MIQFKFCGGWAATINVSFETAPSCWGGCDKGKVFLQ
jgi:hypothetical protein